MSRDASTPAPRRRVLWHDLIAVVAVTATSLVLGGLTSFGQGWLPSALRPFANSVGGWTILTFVVVAIARRGPVVSAISGLLSFHALLQGYALVSTMRGFYDAYGPGNIFFDVAFLAGPVVGLCAGWQGAPRRLLRGIGAGVVCGLLISDAAVSLMRVAETTGWIYWTLQALVAAGYLAFVLVRRLGTGREVRFALAATFAAGVAMGAGAIVLL